MNGWTDGPDAYVDPYENLDGICTNYALQKWRAGRTFFREEKKQEENNGKNVTTYLLKRKKTTTKKQKTAGGASRQLMVAKSREKGEEAASPAALGGGSHDTRGALINTSFGPAFFLSMGKFIHFNGEYILPVSGGIGQLAHFNGSIVPIEWRL